MRYADRQFNPLRLVRFAKIVRLILTRVAAIALLTARRLVMAGFPSPLGGLGV